MSSQGDQQESKSNNNNNIQVIDSHLHVWATEEESKSLNYPYAPSQTPPSSLIDISSTKSLLERMKDSQVDGALIVQPINHKYDHRYVEDAMKAYPTKLKGMMLFDPDPNIGVDDAVQTLEDLALRGFVGVRFNPYLWPASGDRNALMSEEGKSGLAVYKRCGELNLPVGIMCFKGLHLHYDDIVQLLEASPKTTMILDHLAFTSIEKDKEDEDAKLTMDNFEKLKSLAKYPNVIVKVSALFRVAGTNNSYPFERVRKERFVPLLEAFGKDRLMFGTDFPFVLEQEGGYDGAVSLVKQWCSDCEKNDADNDIGNAILSGTAIRLFGTWS